MEITRRRFLAGAAGVLGASLLPAGRVALGAAGEGPPGFPAATVPAFRQRYQTWSKEIVLDDLWTCRPTTPDQVVTLANWAATAGWRLRPRGSMHGWSPFVVPPDTTQASKVVLVDSSGLAHIGASPGGVRAGAGAHLLDVLVHLEGRGLGLPSVPAVGDVTVGGMLAIGAHGAATHVGSISHAARELTAVVWDKRTDRYVLRTFGRDDAELKSLACALGRTFVTEAVLDAPPLERLRCRSYVDITAAELFAPPGAGGRTLASFFEATGRAEALWYPFTERPWLKVWEVAAKRPLTSRPTSAPYNYPFSDQIPEDVADVSAQLVNGSPQSAPVFGQVVYGVTAAGLAATASFDLWGAAKNTQLYIQPTTLRVRELGLAILTSREDLQHTAHLLATAWTGLIDEHAARGSYPVNMPLEIRACGLDGRLGDAPILAATSPDPSAPHLDVVLYTNPLTLTGTPGSDAFYAEYERLVRSSLDGRRAVVRPEWSKNFAFSAAGPVTDAAALSEIRDQFRRGRTRSTSWDGAAATFERLDPHGVFSNDFLDVLFER